MDFSSTWSPLTSPSPFGPIGSSASTMQKFRMPPPPPGPMFHNCAMSQQQQKKMPPLDSKLTITLSELLGLLNSAQQINSVKTSRLHISNIPFRYRREHLAQMFSYFGDIIDSEVIFNERGSKGFGFVSFARADDAERAKRAFDGIVIDQRKIEVNYATPKPRKSKRSTSSSTT